MRTLVGLYMGIKKSYYTEQDGTVHENHTALIENKVWRTIFIFGILATGWALR